MSEPRILIIEDEVLPSCTQHGLGVLGYTPLEVGLSFLPANLIMGFFSLGLSAKKGGKGAGFVLTSTASHEEILGFAEKLQGKAATSGIFAFPPIIDVKIDQPGLYPFVSHAFAAVDQGQVGLLKVGHVHGTMSH